MRALVVFESMFGNTEEIALAIADGLQTAYDVDVVNVDEAPPVLSSDIDLLVVGAPTHALGLSRAQTRSEAATRAPGETVTKHKNLRDWLASASRSRNTVYAVAFATRAVKVRWLPGSAARAAAKLLRRRGFESLVKPTDFYVEDTLGPLLPGEVSRARIWGAEVAAKRVESDLDRL
ncbi:flavodoxin domain-containing protein [Antrihabitans sp. YC2-6]|uniref:flavodoxin domain-containing protein n=1 Tax=Antrihabitans sp. YC2-6 TaxID=2799498 RepID=UPI0018F53371|nr:flavodoxin domain-containing protein [Antrihabitans sp. YC2-6]MBJ8347011.1 flavodoxin family protein [Antrihabitans sp. YC2-6]